LKSWKYLHKLTSGEWDGKKTANPCDDGEMWECPELFPLDGGHVLIYSTLGKVFWESGVLDEVTMKFTPKQKGELDWGGFYAPKTQLDASSRRILWGWIQEKNRSDSQMREAGWSGMMSLPRVLNLRPDGTLRIQELPQISSLRDGVLKTSRTGDTTNVTLPHANGEVICLGQHKDFEFRMSDGINELMTVRYVAASRSFLAADKEIALGEEDQPKIHAFVDASVIEMILGERVGYTKRFYYTAAVAPAIHVSITGSTDLTLDAWKIKPISTDRLTTA
jgi:beta-fructofuranosidase